MSEASDNHKNYFQLLGRICSYWRKKQSITLTGLAAEIDMTPSALYKFEEGRSNTATILLHYIKRGIVGDTYLPSYKKFMMYQDNNLVEQLYEIHTKLVL